jgi:hypothetical protein
MLQGQAITLWFIGSGAACILLLSWASIAGLGAQKYRALSVGLLLLTGALASLPVGVGALQSGGGFPFGPTLFAGATLCLLAALAILWRLRRGEGLQRYCDLGIASSLNLWIALWVTLTPLSGF